MGSLPDLIFVIDTVREQIAIKEAKKLNIPIAAIIDSNSDPDGITFPIPGNDDSTKSIKLYCDLISQAALDGISIQSKEDVKTQDNPKEGEEKSLSKSDIVSEKQKRDIKDQKNTAEVAESETKDDEEDSKDKNQEKSLDKDKKD
jgi:small subunit ribosomal protein S2